MTERIKGRATARATREYQARHAAAAGHVRVASLAEPVALSSIGIGTYLGADDDETDARYAGAIDAALGLGINVVDTAVNYRCQRSERVIGRVLAAAIGAATVAREEIVVASKAGYVPFDGARPRNYPAYIQERFVEPGIIEAGALAGGVHCMSPRFLDHCIEQSRTNLGLDTIDIYYLHNPESHMEGITRPEWLGRVRRAFETLERAASDGRIGVYGTATWSGFRQPPGAPTHHSLAELVALAEAVGGSGHHFRVVQLPFNLGMVEAYADATQAIDGKPVSLLAAARHHGITVMASAPILQGQLTEGLDEEVRASLGLSTDAQRAVQFVRSTPGVTTALVGMSRAEHVAEIARVAAEPLLDDGAFQKLPWDE